IPRFHAPVALTRGEHKLCASELSAVVDICSTVWGLMGSDLQWQREMDFGWPSNSGQLIRSVNP
ncbi:hypothetical protein AVEN_128674-1, partial [Araneus ventricosus]